MSEMGQRIQNIGDFGIKQQHTDKWHVGRALKCDQNQIEPEPIT